MTFTHRSTLARAGVVALLAAGGLTAVAAPAHAADQADLQLIPLSYQLAKGVKEAKAKPFKFQVDNTTGTVDAKDVRVTVETKGLKDKKVGVLVPAGCDTDGTRFSCLLGDLAAGTTEDFGIPLFSTGGKGAGGTLVVTISAATADPDLENNTVEHDITVTKPGYDLTSWVQDVYADVTVDADEAGESGLRPVKPGETAPLDWAVYNDGSRKATGLAYGIFLPAGVSFAELPEGCAEQVLGGLAQAYCEDSGVVLRPGEYYTADVRVKVGAEVTEPVLRPGFFFAEGLDAVAGVPAEQPQVASKAQRKTFSEADDGDNAAQFDVFVDLTTQPSPEPTPTPTPSAEPTPGGTPTAQPTASPTTGGGAGGGGGLPVTGVQAGLIGGIGAAVLLAGAVLMVLSRRRRVVVVAPGDETSDD
ncbi:MULTISPECIES: cell wall anchor protein [Micromonospora]|uniref:Cell wall anchor protein n=1 Tax=Micromonospora solifontis TaxID=2487138 RepID=A0ABX9WMW8_9ACTN|nr:MULTISPECIES: cell wall anchor protein [Micromonospora]NES13320.1 cell wall anchor protein [Micromonospora sp. PPF5-17B]NES34689.1 cell wall anchor protein [Micromonospora solifontis]NES57205.1 cell wall anchor protein [Micromonospora sp. PPF5-6]RNM01928.1 cell wall anchor protein [Micromonospora solifontis]